MTISPKKTSMPERPRGLVERLKYLDTLLKCLPKEAGLQLPPPGKSIYQFQDFSIPPEFIERTESEVGGFNEALKSTFGWQTRTTGMGLIQIKERGPGIEAIVGVFDMYLNKYPGDAVIVKWLEDVISGAENIYEQVNAKVSNASQCHSRY
jgi:hypothetical protein